VFIDQRGTGQSHALRCPFGGDVTARLAPMFDASHSAGCRALLERDHDLRFYTTSDAAQDTDAVRRALGYARLNLHGSSYGTRAAWAYAARYPKHARTMILWGPAPPGFHLPEPFAQGLEVALDGVIGACLAERACAERYPTLRRDVQRAFDRLRERPATVRVSARDGVVREGTLGLDEFAEAVRYQLYFMHRTRTLPSLLARAAAGDYSPIAQESVTSRYLLEDLNRGMFLAVTCAEDIPFIDEAAARAASANTHLGMYRVKQQMEACRDWPRGSSDWSAGARPLPVATLVQAGEFDPATPLAQARDGMRLLPKGKLVVVPHGAHNFSGLGVDDCLRQMNQALITSGSAEGVDTSCISAARREPFVLR
jgi:pimeloyl-ACP methyl ester carboxylesterase